MEIILIENVDKLGSRGQLVKVADGYGRNYLLPKKLAVAATPQNRAWVHQQRVRFLKLEAKEKGEAAELAQILDGVSLTFSRKSGEHVTLFGSVTAIDVAEGLNSQGYHIDRRKIQLSNPLKVVGEYDVPIRLHREVTATIKVKVEAEKSPEVIAAEADSLCISYFPAQDIQVHNANTLGAGLLARTFGHTRKDSYRGLAEKAIRYTVRHQRRDHSWYYGEADNLHWVDNFHTAYVLDSLKHYTEGSGDL